MKTTLCPKCGYTMEATTKAYGETDRSKPKEGDIGICFGCLTPMIFDADLKLRAVTKKDDVELPGALVTQLRMLRAIKEITGETAGNKKGTTN